MSGKNFLTPEIWEKKFLLKQNHPYPPSPTKVTWSTTQREGEEADLTPYLMLSINKMAGALKTKFCISRLKVRPIKDTNEKRKFKRMLSFLFVGKRELFAMKLQFRGIQSCFLHGGSERLACFKPTKEARFLKKLEVHSVYSIVFTKVSQAFSTFLHRRERKPQNVHSKFKNRPFARWRQFYSYDQNPFRFSFHI